MNKFIDIFKEEDFKYTKGRLWGGYDLMSHSTLKEKQAIMGLSSKIWGDKGEAVYEGILSPQDFLYQNFPLDDIRSFFRSDFINKIDPYNWNWEWEYDNLDYMQGEAFIKLVWLCGILIDEGGFKYTLGSHFNPVYNNIVIHPGGVRQHAMRLFPPKEVKVIHFDTFGNKSLMRNKEFKKIDNYIEFCELNDYQIVFTPDHGTFIPHPLKGTGGIPTAKINQYEKTKLILNNLNLESNRKLPLINRYHNKNNSNKCIVKYKKQDLEKISTPNLYRILILICLGKNYETEDFKITWKK